MKAPIHQKKVPLELQIMIWNLVCKPIDIQWLEDGTHHAKDRNQGIVNAILILPCFRHHLSLVHQRRSLHQSSIGYFRPKETLFYYDLPSGASYIPCAMALFLEDDNLRRHVGNIQITMSGIPPISFTDALRVFLRLKTVKFRLSSGGRSQRHWWGFSPRDYVNQISADIVGHITNACNASRHGGRKEPDPPWTVPVIIIEEI